MYLHANGMFFKVKTHYEVSFQESCQGLSEKKVFAKYVDKKFHSYAWLKLLLKLSCVFYRQAASNIIITKKTAGVIEFEESFSQLISPRRTTAKVNEPDFEERKSSIAA
jgi:hypothetical protein